MEAKKRAFDVIAVEALGHVVQLIVSSRGPGPVCLTTASFQKSKFNAKRFRFTQYAGMDTFILNRTFFALRVGGRNWYRLRRCCRRSPAIGHAWEQCFFLCLAKFLDGRRDINPHRLVDLLRL